MAIQILYDIAAIIKKIREKKTEKIFRRENDDPLCARLILKRIIIKNLQEFILKISTQPRIFFIC